MQTEDILFNEDEYDLVLIGFNSDEMDHNRMWINIGINHCNKCLTLVS